MKLIPLKNREIESILKKHGFKLIGKSKHGLEYYNFETKELVRVPNHPAKVCSTGTLNSIIRNSGLTREQFYSKR